MWNYTKCLHFMWLQYRKLKISNRREKNGTSPKREERKGGGEPLSFFLFSLLRYGFTFFPLLRTFWKICHENNISSVFSVDRVYLNLKGTHIVYTTRVCHRACSIYPWSNVNFEDNCWASFTCFCDREHFQFGFLRGAMRVCGGLKLLTCVFMSHVFRLVSCGVSHTTLLFLRSRLRL